jgi:alpha-mannosidase
LFTHRIDDAAHIQMIYWSAPGRSKPGFDEAKRQLNGRGKKAIKGMEFGPSCEYTVYPSSALLVIN